MPIYLKDVDVVPEVSKFQSALIVLCRFCPAASLAMRKDKPSIVKYSLVWNLKVFLKRYRNSGCPSI